MARPRRRRMCRWCWWCWPWYSGAGTGPSRWKPLLIHLTSYLLSSKAIRISTAFASFSRYISLPTYHPSPSFVSLSSISPLYHTNHLSSSPLPPSSSLEPPISIHAVWNWWRNIWLLSLVCVYGIVWSHVRDFQCGIGKGGRIDSWGWWRGWVIWSRGVIRGTRVVNCWVLWGCCCCLRFDLQVLILLQFLWLVR